jgi:F0F1-type ATP synthase membrane subunit b/b'
MSDLVHADPADVKKLTRALQQYQQRINEASKQARQAINRANWKDKRKQQFEDKFRNFQKQTDNFVGAQTKDFIKQLNALAADLERARSHKF